MGQLNIIHAALFVAFVATLVAYVVLAFKGVAGGPIDELLLVLGGAIAGAAVPRSTA